MSGASHAADGRKLGFVESIPGDWTLRSWWLHTTESGERLEINNDQLSDQLTGKLGFKIETHTQREDAMMRILTNHSVITGDLNITTLQTFTRTSEIMQKESILFNSFFHPQ